MKTSLIAASIVTVGFMTVSDVHAGDGHGKAKEHHAEKFKEADTNNDGLISKSEMIARANARFAEKDTNNDGSISQEEMYAAMKDRRKNMMDKMAARKEMRAEKESE